MREAKQNAISRTSKETLVVTMDVQSGLICPELLVSKHCYTQKLQLHDFTIYASNNKNTHLYVWNEGDGTDVANELNHLCCYLQQEEYALQKIILISDGCA